MATKPKQQTTLFCCHFVAVVVSFGTSFIDNKCANDSAKAWSKRIHTYKLTIMITWAQTWSVLCAIIICNPNDHWAMAEVGEAKELEVVERSSLLLSSGSKQSDGRTQRNTTTQLSHVYMYMYWCVCFGFSFGPLKTKRINNMASKKRQTSQATFLLLTLRNVVKNVKKKKQQRQQLEHEMSFTHSQTHSHSVVFPVTVQFFF